MAPLPPRRLTDLPLPSYRHIPGETPHPTRSAEGHSYNPGGAQPDLPGLPDLPDLNRSAPLACEEFLYGVDLFNGGYWWECHEALEGLWRVAGRGSPAGHVLQAVIMCAVAHLKIIKGNTVGARRLFHNAERHVFEAEKMDLGLDLIGMLAETGAFVFQDSEKPAVLRLLD
ncbi:hypothetical protein CSA17_06940 [bacterium DOLJORAL78_65_58]|nr:MAG: hypothetical protein CSB20_01560 [bacterium DOLZORAL124_64_63]PIE75538.1 MAG: hypothetical protein CSA17_06940 [bacterium DOLJORAL78_65_58]